MNLAMPLPRIENRLRKNPAKERDQLLQGLLQPQARINPKYFYDDCGCEIFTRICELDEYYPTRTEEAVFQTYASDIAQRLPEHAQWIDLGCGDCAKSPGSNASAWSATLPSNWTSPACSRSGPIVRRSFSTPARRSAILPGPMHYNCCRPYAVTAALTAEC